MNQEGDSDLAHSPSPLSSFSTPASVPTTDTQPARKSRDAKYGSLQLVPAHAAPRVGGGVKEVATGEEVGRGVLFELGDVDVIAPTQSVKELFKIPYSDRPVSQIVYRLGETLLLDSVDPATAGLSPHSVFHSDLAGSNSNSNSNNNSNDNATSRNKGVSDVERHSRAPVFHAYDWNAVAAAATPMLLDAALPDSSSKSRSAQLQERHTALQPFGKATQPVSYADVARGRAGPLANDSTTVPPAPAINSVDASSVFDSKLEGSAQTALVPIASSPSRFSAKNLLAQLAKFDGFVASSSPLESQESADASPNRRSMGTPFAAASTSKAQDTTPRPSFASLPTAPSSLALAPFRQVVEWGFNGRHMVLGSNLHVLQGTLRQLYQQQARHETKSDCSNDNSKEGAHSHLDPDAVTTVAVAFRDVNGAPVAAAEGLDLYLDAKMADVAHVALCYHDQGRVCSYRIMAIEDVPRLFSEGPLLAGDLSSPPRADSHETAGSVERVLNEQSPGSTATKKSRALPQPHALAAGTNADTNLQQLPNQQDVVHEPHGAQSRRAPSPHQPKTGSTCKHGDDSSSAATTGSVPSSSPSASADNGTPFLFSTDVVERNGETILRFLSEHTSSFSLPNDGCSNDGAHPTKGARSSSSNSGGVGGYWLYREGGTGPVRLYDLAAVAPASVQRGWKYTMAMMCYRYAMKCRAPEKLYQNWTSRHAAPSNNLWAFISPTRQRLLSKCLDLLDELSADAEANYTGHVGGSDARSSHFVASDLSTTVELKKYATIKASVQEQLADVRVAEVLATGVNARISRPQTLLNQAREGQSATTGDAQTRTASTAMSTKMLTNAQGTLHQGCIQQEVRAVAGGSNVGLPPQKFEAASVSVSGGGKVGSPTESKVGTTWDDRVCGLESAAQHLMEAISMLRSTASSFRLASQLSCYRAKLADCYLLLAVELQGVREHTGGPQHAASTLNGQRQPNTVGDAVGVSTSTSSLASSPPTPISRNESESRQGGATTVDGSLGISGTVPDYHLSQLHGGIACLERSLRERRKMRELLVEQGGKVSSIFAARDELEFNSHFLRVAGELIFKLAARASSGVLDTVLLRSRSHSSFPNVPTAQTGLHSPQAANSVLPPTCVSNSQLWAQFESLNRMLDDMIPSSLTEGAPVESLEKVLSITAGMRSQTAGAGGKAGDTGSDQLPTKDAHPLLQRFRTIDVLLQRSISCFAASSHWHQEHVKASDSKKLPKQTKGPSKPRVTQRSVTDAIGTERQTPHDARADEDMDADDEGVTLQKKLAFTWNERARFQLELGRFADAVRAFTRAAELFEAVGDAPNLALAYCNLAHCFKTMATTPSPTNEAKGKSKGPLATTTSSDTLTLQQRTQYESAVEFCHRGLRVLAANATVHAAMKPIINHKAASLESQRHKTDTLRRSANEDEVSSANHAEYTTMVQVRRRLREQEAMVCLIHGVRLGRQCSEAPLERRLQFPKWCGRGAEMKAVQLLQTALDLFVAMAREDRGESLADVLPKAKVCGNHRSGSKSSNLHDGRKHQRRPSKESAGNNSNSTSSISTIPVRSKQIASAHFQLALLYRQLFHRDTRTDGDGLPLKTPPADLSKKLRHQLQQQRTMPLRLMYQNALAHHRHSLGFFVELHQQWRSKLAWRHDRAIALNPDHSMLFLLHRDSAALHLAAANHVTSSDDTKARGSFTDADTPNASVAMAFFVRALDELAATAKYFEDCFVLDDSKLCLRGGSPSINTLYTQLESVWRLLLFVLRSVVKVASTGPIRLVSAEQAASFRSIYLTALQNQCSGNQCGSNGESIASIAALRRAVLALQAIGNQIATINVSTKTR